MSDKEIVELEVYIKNSVVSSESRYFTTTVICNIDNWHLAATRWITNLCGSLKGTHFQPVGPIRCRRADYAVFLGHDSSLINSDYAYFGSIPYDEWAVSD